MLQGEVLDISNGSETFGNKNTGNISGIIIMTEEQRLKLENLCHLKQAASILRDVLPHRKYGITLEEYQQIARPLAMKITELLNEDTG